VDCLAAEQDFRAAANNLRRFVARHFGRQVTNGRR
jgi:hypothetical protein